MTYCEIVALEDEQKIIDKCSEFVKSLTFKNYDAVLDLTYEESKIMSNFCLPRYYETNYCGPKTMHVLNVFHFDETLQLLFEEWCRCRLSINGEEPRFAAKYTFLLWFSVNFVSFPPRSLDDATDQLLIYLFWSRLFHDNLSFFKNVCFELITKITDFQSNSLESNNTFVESSFICLQFHLQFMDFALAKISIDQISDILNINQQLTGILGKRTKFQTSDVPQLALNIKAESVNPPDNIVTIIPQNILLQDDTLLSEINFSTQPIVPDLDYRQQDLLLYICVYYFHRAPMHELMDEQISAYLSVVLKQPKTYLIGRVALFLRSSLERNSSRKCERALLQLETLISEYMDTTKEHYLLNWRSTVTLSHWQIKELLGEMLFKMGCINSALEIYMDLKSYDNIIKCYLATGRREKAEELLKNEISIKGESSTLLCFLGQINDDPSFYLRAWDLSNHKSFRAVHQLGYYHLHRKQFTECVKYFELALAINSIHPNTWYNLGCIYMDMNKFSDAARTLRTCCHLQPDNFKAWTNLATILSKQGKQESACKAIEIAISCNYDHPQIWVRYAQISMDMNHGSNVLRALERLLEIQPQSIDDEIISYLARYFLQNQEIPIKLQFNQRLISALNKQCGIISPSYTFWWMFARIIRVSSPERAREYYDNALQILVYQDIKIGPHLVDVISICDEIADLIKEEVKTDQVSTDINLKFDNIQHRLLSVLESSTEESIKNDFQSAIDAISTIQLTLT